MLFSSNIFIFAFLPIVLIIYYIINPKFRNIFLLIASLIFYAWGEPKFVFIMIMSIIANYLFALLIHYVKNRTKKKIYVRLSIAFMLIFNLTIMFIFKYLNFTLSNINNVFGNILPQSNIILPIGISFFTFQAISYVMDVYRGNGEVQKNPLNVGLYISLFPQLIAGPIVRYETVAKEIGTRKETFSEFSEGVQRFIIGLCKKIIIANNMAIIADKTFSTKAFGELSVSFAWLGALAYTFQIFFDFSGYSDMAIGLGKMFGFHFLENFNYPYISKSVSDFWRRWHISLSTWFRDYVYIPLGGSRVNSKPKLVRNLFVVWILTGVWHGANWTFIVWGLMYFVLLAIEKLSGYPNKFKSPVAKGIYQLFTLLCIIGGWVIFRAPDLKYAIKYGMSMFGLNGNPFSDSQATFYFNEYLVLLLAALLFSFPVVRWIKQKLKNKFGENMLHKLEYSVPVVYMALFILAISYLILGAHNPFIYFNF
jgi:D-alanyl-lipoteichoic acid acyltransferase DltB (MBOAT superfamily)